MNNRPAAPSDVARLRRKPPRLLRTALIVAAYLCGFIILDLLSQQLEELRGIVAWYPPAGLTYTLLLVFGAGFAPAVTAALLLSSLFIYRIPQPPGLLFLWAVISSLIYGAAAWFLGHRIRFDWQLRKSRDVTWLVVTTVFVSALLAVLSVSSSALSSDMPRSEVLRSILVWWIGETVGVLTVTPFLLIHVMPRLGRFAEGQSVGLPARVAFPPPTLSVIGQAFSIALVFYWVFGGSGLNEFRTVYLLTLPLIWIALDHGLKGVTAGIAVLNLGVMLAMWFLRFDVAHIGELQLLMIVDCLVGLLMGAAVTERRRAQDELRASEEEYRRLLTDISDGIFVTDGRGVVLFANPALARIHGFQHPDQLVGRNFNEFVAPLYSNAIAGYFQRIASGEQPPEAIILELVRPDGAQTTVEVRASPQEAGGKVVGTHGVARDVTGRKQADEEIKALSRFPAENPNPILRVDNHGRIMYANAASNSLLRLWNCMVGGYLPPDWRDRIASSSENGGRTTVDVECEGMFYSILIMPIPESGYVNLYGRDVTERKQAEELLVEERDLLTTLVDHLPDNIFVKDVMGRIIMDNDAHRRLLGAKTLEQVVGKTDFDFFPAELAAQYDADEKKVVQSGEALIDRTEPVLDRDNAERWLLTSKVPIRNRQGKVTGIVGINRDITERKRAEDEIKKQLDELRRWQSATMGRETRILDVKHEVNDLLVSAGKPPRYPSAESTGQKEK